LVKEDYELIEQHLGIGLGTLPRNRAGIKVMKGIDGGRMYIPIDSILMKEGEKYNV
jgi:hypothetical protein